MSSEPPDSDLVERVFLAFCEGSWTQLADFAWRRYVEEGRPIAVLISWSNLERFAAGALNAIPYTSFWLDDGARDTPEHAQFVDAINQHDPKRQIFVACQLSDPPAGQWQGPAIWRVLDGDPANGKPFPPDAAKSRAH